MHQVSGGATSALLSQGAASFPCDRHTPMNEASLTPRGGSVENGK